jgi:hypothetical protein
MTDAWLSRIEGRVRVVLNPVTTAVTRWWCHSALRHALTGYGRTGRQRRLVRSRTVRSAARVPSAVQMKARTAAVDRLLEALRSGRSEK